MAGSHLLRTERSSVEDGPNPLDGLELRLCKPSKESRGKEGFAFVDMGLQMERGHDEVDVEEGLGKLEVFGHFRHSSPEVDAPLATDIVGGYEGEDRDADDTGEEYVVHVRIARCMRHR